MKKFILSAIIMALCSQGFASQQYGIQNDNGEIFLSLTKYAEPLKDLTTNLTVITQKEIKEKHAENLGDIIEGELGITYKNNGPLGQSPSVFIRGANSGQTLVLIDGRPINDPALGGAFFTSIPANMIEKVEIIRGAGCAVYGTGAFGGVINVITKKATPFMSNVNPCFSYGTFNTINAGVTGAYANDIVSILAAPSLLSSDGYRENSFYNSKNIFSKIAIRPTENSEFILSGQAYNADNGNPGSLSSPSLADKQFEDNNYLKLDYLTKINDFNIQLSGYNSNSNRETYSYGTWYNFYTEDSGLKTFFSYNEIFFTGIEYYKTTYEQKKSYKKSREKTAGYLQAFLNIGKLTFIPVIRYETSTDYDDVFTPAISAIFKATDKIKVSANISKVWNAPNFDSLYYPYSGNPNLKPEEGISSDIGIEYSENNFSVALTGFYITSKNLISWASSDPSDPWAFWYPYNIDESKQYGCEFGLRYDMTKKIKHKLNYTYLKAENTKTHTNLQYRPMHNLNYIITVKPTDSLQLAADTSYVTTFFDETYNNYLKDYCLVNVRADYQITKNIAVWVKCDNLTNQDYQLSYGYPMAGIIGHTGIDIKF